MQMYHYGHFSGVKKARIVATCKATIVCMWTWEEGPATGDGDVRKGRESARMLRRASILRQLDEGQKMGQVAENVGVARKTVRAIARRYEEEGLDSALHEKPRPGTERALNTTQSQHIVAMVCGSPPEGRARWSVRLIAEEGSVNFLSHF